MRQTSGGPSHTIRSQLDCSNLTPERERTLLFTVRSGRDERLRQAARTELWESHSKLVVAIASRYRHPKIEFLDLVGAGHLGLHAAITRFEPDRFGSRLATYAISWIRWYVQDYLQRNSGPLRLPGSSAHRQLLRMGRRLYAEARRSCERECVEPTEGELCERIGRRIGLSGDEVARSLRLIEGGSVSLHAQPAGDAGAPTLAETLADGNAATEDEVILRLDRAKARKRIIHLAEEILGERERTVFFARCMTDSEDVVHLVTLAGQLGVSSERVYQLEASAKRKIATALAGEGYTEIFRKGEALPMQLVRAPRRRSMPASEPAQPAALAVGGAGS